MCWAKPAKGVIQQHRDHVKIFRQNSWGNWNNLEIYAELSRLTMLPGKPESNQKILKHLFLTCCKWEFNAFLKQTFTLKSTCIYILKVKNASQKGLNFRLFPCLSFSQCLSSRRKQRNSLFSHPCNCSLAFKTLSVFRLFMAKSKMFSEPLWILLFMSWVKWELIIKVIWFFPFLKKSQTKTSICTRSRDSKLAQRSYLNN